MDWIKSNDLWGVSLNQGMNRIEMRTSRLSGAESCWQSVLSVVIKVIALCFLVVSLTIDSNSKVPRTQLPAPST